MCWRKREDVHLFAVESDSGLDGGLFSGLCPSNTDRADWAIVPPLVHNTRWLSADSWLFTECAIYIQTSRCATTVLFAVTCLELLICISYGMTYMFVILKRNKRKIKCEIWLKRRSWLLIWNYNLIPVVTIVLIYRDLHILP